MRIALFGITPSVEHRNAIGLLLDELSARQVKLSVFEPFYHYLTDTLGITPKIESLFNLPEEIKESCAILLSIGGDGTFLESAAYVQDSGIPIAGINFGRLGFLAHISSSTIIESIGQLCQGKYSVEHRSVLQVDPPCPISVDSPYALNDITIQKRGTAMITVEAYINQKYLCTYWADGLILSTPTGSTAYSLSVGGPILSPGVKAFALSAIAPHNLTVRPLVIPDDSTITLVASSRDNELLASIDSRTFDLPSPVKLSISKAKFHINIVNLLGTSYYTTLRNKLMWGADQRNSTP